MKVFKPFRGGSVSSTHPQYDRGARIARWACMLLVLVSFPLGSENGQAIIALLIFTLGYSLLRYSKRLRHSQIVGSRINELAIDHFMVICLVVLSGGINSPYYPLMLLLIMAMIASYGIAGFAIGVAVQSLFLVVTYGSERAILPSDPQAQLTIKLAFLILFSLVAEQSITSRDEEHLIDTQEAKRLGRDRERLLTLVNSIADPVIAVDSKGSITLFNGATLALLNTNNVEHGLPFDAAVPLRTSDGHRLAFMRLVKGGEAVVRNDLSTGSPESGDIKLELTAAPVRTSHGQRRLTDGYIVVLRDITRQRSIDEERSEFISVASHELRTPVAVAEANLSTLLLPGFTKLDKKAATLLTQTHDSIIALGELVQDLTTLSRAERGDIRPDISLVDLGGLLVSLWRDYKATAESKGLQLIFVAPDQVVSAVTAKDETREIVQNLITNAIKYTEKGDIKLSLERDSDGTVAVHVTDTGIGIGVTDQGKIFNKFYRSEDFRTRKTNGTGLGLYITHKLAARIGAEIRVNSRLNSGSTFSLVLPPKEPINDSHNA